MSNIRISLFGSMNIERKGEDDPAKLTTTSGLLFAYLVLHREQPQPRDVVASMLWGEYPTKKARACFNTALWRLRQVLDVKEEDWTESHILSTSTGDIFLACQDSLWVDVIEFEESLRKCFSTPVDKATNEHIRQLEETLKIYKDDFLKGCYSDWALKERERLCHSYLDILYYLMNYYESNHHYNEAIAKGKRILETDPLREDVHRKMMILYIHCGQRSLAIRQYHQCCEILKTELDVEPMLETQILQKKVLAQDLTAAFVTHHTDGEISAALAELRSAVEMLGRAEQSLRKVLFK